MIPQTKKRLGMVVILILVTGGIFMIQRNTPFDIFLTKDHTKPTKADQIAYLKKHEQEMTDYIKSQNPKITSVQWDWKSVKIEEVQPNAGGIYTRDKYKNLVIIGQFNEIKESSLTLDFNFNIDELYPSMNDMVWSSNSLRVTREIDGTKVGVPYE